MPYVQYEWETGVGGGTPISEANLDHLETQYDEADADLTAHKTNSGAPGVHRWTNAKLLLGAGAGADPTEVDLPPVDATVGDIVEANSQAEVSEAGVAYVKHKEIVIGRDGTYRISFDLKSTAANGYGRIYKNGAAEGTERIETDDYTNYSEDIAGWSKGDLCQLYLKITGGATASAKMFKVASSNPGISGVNL